MSAFLLQTMTSDTYPNKSGTVVFEHSFVDEGGFEDKALTSQAMSEESESLSDLDWTVLLSGDSSGGLYCYLPPMTKLVSTFKKLITEVAMSCDYLEYIFPRHYTRHDLEAFGWLNHQNLRRELMVIKPLEADSNRTNLELFGDPLQCPGFYAMLAAIQEKESGVLPDRLFEGQGLRAFEHQGGWTIRNEEKKRLLGGWATAFEFSGAELVFAGFEEEAFQTRWDTFIAMAKLLDSLELKYRVVISDSCVRNCLHPELKEQVLPLYKIPTLDFELFIPATLTTESYWLEVGGGDVAGTRLADNYKLKSASGRAILSGCQGFGWQRGIFAFLSQKGLDPSNWPDIVIDLYGTRHAPNPLGGIGELNVIE